MSALVTSTDPIVSVIDGQVRADSRELAKVFGKRHADVLRAIDGLMKTLPGACERSFAFTSAPTRMPNGGVRQERYCLMDRDGFTLAVMGFNGSAATIWKVGYISAFNAMEEELRRRQPPPFDPNDPASLRVVLLGYAEANLALKAENAQISQALTVSESALATAAPKVEFFDRFANADGHYGLQNAARSIGAPPKAFVDWLKGTYLFYQGRELMPKAAFVKMAIFTVHPFLDGDVARAQTFVTPYGLQYLAKKWQRHTMMPEGPRDLFGNAA